MYFHDLIHLQMREDSSFSLHTLETHLGSPISKHSVLVESLSNMLVKYERGLWLLLDMSVQVIPTAFK